MFGHNLNRGKTLYSRFAGVLVAPKPLVFPNENAISLLSGYAIISTIFFHVGEQ